MKKLIIVCLLAALPSFSFAAMKVHLDPANIDLTDKESLQRGAAMFVNYCLNCHSANFMRYNRMGKDIGLTDKQIKENLLFTGEKVGDPMSVAMTVEDGGKWFGTPPPDLSVISRAKGSGDDGPDWLYTYLRSFYVDESRPFGVNNTVFSNVGMPHVLWELQGMQALTNAAEMEAGAKEHKDVPPVFEIVKVGSMGEEEYDNAIRDLVNYLAYMGEPAKLEREGMAWYVLIFIAIFTLVAYFMKKEFWKDIH